MVKVNVGTADLSLPTPGTAKTGREVKGASDDFKKLLQGKQESPKDSKENTEVKKDSKPEKEIRTEDVKGEEAEKPEDTQTQNLLTAYQLSQGFRPEMTQTELQMTEEVIPDTILPTVQAEAVPEVQTLPQVPVTDETQPMIQTEAAVQNVPAAEVTDHNVLAEAQAVQTQTVEPKKAAEPADTAKNQAPAEVNEQTVQPAAARPSQKREEHASAQDDRESQTDYHGAEQTAALPGSEAPVRTGAEEEKPVQVTKMYVPQPEELPDKVADQLLTKIVEGVTEFEIHIEPANLGKIAVKILYDHGQANISILCSEKKALDVLGNNAREIGDVVQRNLGGETTIIVEKQEPDYLNQNREENQQNKQNEQEQQKENNNKKQNADDAEQFLQKLRLGLTGL